MTFNPFDPLEFKTSVVTEAALNAVKREINNILSSYVGWYDPFCELIQNSLDAVEARAEYESSTGALQYTPKINITIDLCENTLTVTDNGIGLDEDKFHQFLAPNFSFKSGVTRGHKGVGATYVAYGFNYMSVATKIPGYQATGRIINARKWLSDHAAAGNPKVEPNPQAISDEQYHKNDRGVSITVRFDESTHPRRLDWIKADNAETWHKILSVKTGLGSIKPDRNIEVCVKVIAADKITEYRNTGTSYHWLHPAATKTASLRSLEEAAQLNFQKYGLGRALPDRYRNLDFIFDSWDAQELTARLGENFSEEEKELVERYRPSVAFEYAYTSKFWANFNDGLGVRKDYKVLTSGIQLAANNMPQGETMLIPLNRNIGRQNQIHFLFHFENYSPDLGRKGFHRELNDFAKDTAKTITDSILQKYRPNLKQNTGVAPDLARELDVSEWKQKMLNHENELPIMLGSKHFFKPTERISITSAPTREQDVIALFNQLVAGGVIRGIQIMSTNERFVYDGLYKVALDLDPRIYIYHPSENPLGISAEIAEKLTGKITTPRVLEYKFSLDGLIEDLNTHDKNINDINLCVVWETGGMYNDRYGITSFLIPENFDQRQYHGVTHVLTDVDTGALHCELIVLSELIDVLNAPEAEFDKQRKKYE